MGVRSRDRGIPQTAVSRMDVRLIEPYVGAIRHIVSRDGLQSEALQYFRTLRLQTRADILPGACVAVALQQMRADTREAIMCLARLSGRDPIDFARDVSQLRGLLRRPFELGWEQLAQASGISPRYAAPAAELFSEFCVKHPGEAMPETRAAALLAATKWKGTRREAATQALALAGLFDAKVIAAQVGLFRPEVPRKEEDPGVIEDRRDALRRASAEIGPVRVPARLVQTTLAFTPAGLSVVRAGSRGRRREMDSGEATQGEFTKHDGAQSG